MVVPPSSWPTASALTQFHEQHVDDEARLTERHADGVRGHGQGASFTTSVAVATITADRASAIIDVIMSIAASPPARPP